ncbi:hypothetical protein C0J52_21528 [Blattella germanica]|nr:hypothetical protein C0J52_21528 [Blattella germanica]
MLEPHLQLYRGDGFGSHHRHRSPSLVYRMHGQPHRKGFFAVRHASRHQAQFFHRMQFISASDLPIQYRPLCKKD